MSAKPAGAARRWLLALALGLAACETTIQSDLTQSQADEILVALHEEAIPARKEREEGATPEPRYRVQVEATQAERALAVLRAAALPRQPAAGLAGLTESRSLVPSPHVERTRIRAALGEELAESLRRIDGVVEARVHLTLASPVAPFASLTWHTDDTPRPRASIMLKHRTQTRPIGEAAVRALVAGAVEGMQPADVAVIYVPAAKRAAPAAPAWVQVGPIQVARGSAGLLRGLGVALLTSNVVLVALLVLLWRGRQPRTAPEMQASR